MLVGVVAFNVLKVMSPTDTRAIGVLLTGYFFQGASCLCSKGCTNASARAWVLYDLLLPVYLRIEGYDRAYFVLLP